MEQADKRVIVEIELMPVSLIHIALRVSCHASILPPIGELVYHLHHQERQEGRGLVGADTLTGCPPLRFDSGERVSPILR